MENGIFEERYVTLSKDLIYMSEKQLFRENIKIIQIKISIYENVHNILTQSSSKLGNIQVYQHRMYIQNVAN